ncbi:hypothetical protein JL2886_03209 [Phaeobacter gallaeciensis]|uniref:Uncharacterized protein n=1 Tax=Phaeobacter gallaeciensis TaxID=60890 RepID=A0A1B0ZVD7_9RHOB|nr:hypothetical protein JL2886_03209 [Phaeobacter gallaeciensis]
MNYNMRSHKPRICPPFVTLLRNVLPNSDQDCFGEAQGSAARAH